MAPLRGRRLFVGTPMYDGKCHSDYAFAIARLTGLCTRFDIELHFQFVTHEALVTKARNIIVDGFLRDGGDHLVFIDADIGFDPRDVLHLLALQAAKDDPRGFDVIAAPYPTKVLAWDVILRAAQAGVADGDPDRLADHASRIALYPVDAEARFPIGEPIEVMQAGTGMMMIRRATFERYHAHYPGIAYGPKGETSAEMRAFFRTEIDGKHDHLAREIRDYLSRYPDATHDDLRAFLESEDAMRDYGGRHISEDYAFCRRVRAAGMRVWLCPWMELTHTGIYRFASRLAQMGAIGEP